jgi:hypothetical protein
MGDEVAKKVIRVTCDTKLRIPLDEMHGLQGKLKTAPIESYNRFRKLVLKRGVNFSFHVWKEVEKVHSASVAKRVAAQKGMSYDGATVVKWWIVDGHLRRLLLTKLRDEEGYTVPDLPCVEIEATSLKDAKQQVLAASSSFHKTTKDGLYEFMNDAGLVYEDLEAFELSDIDLPEFRMEFFDEPAAAEEKGDPKEVSFDAYKGSAIKQVVLHYAAADYDVITKALDALMEKYGVEDYAQVVGRLVREAS